MRLASWLVLMTLTTCLVLYTMKEVFVPFFWALCIAQLAGPALTRTVNVGYRRWSEGLSEEAGSWQRFLGRVCWKACSLVAIACILLLVFGTVAFILFKVQGEVKGVNWGKYSSSSRLIAISNWLKKCGVQISSDQLLELVKGPLNIATGVLFELIEVYFMTALFMTFLLMAKADPLNGGETVERDDRFGPSVPLEMTRSLRSALQNYIVVRTGVALGLFLFTSLLLGRFFGADLWLLFSTLGAFLSFVPLFGSLLASVAPALYLYLDPDHPAAHSILALVLLLLAHLGSSLLARAQFKVELHPAVVLAAILFWWIVWGIPGAIVAVPVTWTLRLLLENVDHPVAGWGYFLLAGRMPILDRRPWRGLELIGRSAAGEDSAAEDPVGKQPLL